MFRLSPRPISKRIRKSSTATPRRADPRDRARLLRQKRKEPRDRTAWPRSRSLGREGQQRRLIANAAAIGLDAQASRKVSPQIPDKLCQPSRDLIRALQWRQMAGSANDGELSAWNDPCHGFGLFRRSDGIRLSYH